MTSVYHKAPVDECEIAVSAGPFGGHAQPSREVGATETPAEAGSAAGAGLPATLPVEPADPSATPAARSSSVAAGAFRDGAEAWANAILGLAISTALVWSLRAAGLWDASAALLSAVFFVASVARGYALRRAFRWWEGSNV